MKPGRYRPWAEDVIRRSPAVAAVEAVQDEAPENAHITYSHVVLATGARIVVHWVGTARPGGDLADEHGDEVIVTGPPPVPVEVPELATAGHVRTGDVEAHLVALLSNGAHPEVAEVVGYSQIPDRQPAGQPYGIRVTCHSGAAIFGLFRHTLPPGRGPSAGTEFKQREEV